MFFYNFLKWTAWEELNSLMSWSRLKVFWTNPPFKGFSLIEIHSSLYPAIIAFESVISEGLSSFQWIPLRLDFPCPPTTFPQNLKDNFLTFIWFFLGRWNCSKRCNFLWEISIGLPFGIEILNIVLHISGRCSVRGTSHSQVRCTLLLVI